MATNSDANFSKEGHASKQGVSSSFQLENTITCLLKEAMQPPSKQ
jgi:hypothetical protein